MESIMMHSQTGSWTQQWATSPQFGNGFVQLVLNQTQNNPATNVHQMQNDIFKLAQCYIDFVGVVTKVYGNFYTSEALQKIWMRVGQKMLMVMKRSCNASKEDIFHTFCMAFNGCFNENLDQIYLNKKFDEYSIA